MAGWLWHGTGTIRSAKHTLHNVRADLYALLVRVDKRTVVLVNFSIGIVGSCWQVHLLLAAPRAKLPVKFQR